MFPGYIDLFLHVLVGVVSYAVGGQYAVLTYCAFAFVHLVLLWLILGDWIESFPRRKEVPLWVWNLLSNLFSLIIITPFAVDWVRSAKEALTSDIDRMSKVLIAPPADGGYRFDNEYCQLGCSVEHLHKVINSLQGQKDLAEAYLKTLWWDATPFAWAFFIVSTIVSLLILLRAQRT